MAAFIKVNSPRVHSGGCVCFAELFYTSLVINSIGKDRSSDSDIAIRSVNHNIRHKTIDIARQHIPVLFKLNIS